MPRWSSGGFHPAVYEPKPMSGGRYRTAIVQVMSILDAQIAEEQLERERLREELSKAPVKSKAAGA